jgi:two-component system response regulator HydG
MPSVLIVDDLISIHEMLEAVIQPTGFSTAFATDGEKALARYKAEKFDMVLADIDMKPMDGITLLKQLKQYDPNSVTIIMTAYASTESAVQALKFGAFDYLQKPFRVDELIATLRRGLEFREIQAQRALVTTGRGRLRPDIEGRLVGKSTQIKKLIQQVKKLAAVRSPVLLVGENGTGKTSVAEILHGVTGARPGAVRADRLLAQLRAEFPRRASRPERRGRPWIREAKGGTLFLQHLQCLALPVQKELVSVLRNTAHGFRLVCATTEDLEKMVDEGRFNDELFYRVASLPLQMPPLRDRKDDIPAPREALRRARPTRSSTRT